MSAGACGLQKRVCDPPKLKFLAVVSHLKWMLGTELGTLQDQEVVLARYLSCLSNPIDGRSLTCSVFNIISRRCVCHLRTGQPLSWPFPEGKFFIYTVERFSALKKKKKKIENIVSGPGIQTS